jgi:hypothetical protein
MGQLKLGKETWSKLKHLRISLCFVTKKKSITQLHGTKKQVNLAIEISCVSVSVTEIETEVTRKLTCKVECEREEYKKHGDRSHVNVGTLKLHLNQKGGTEIYI